MASLLFPGEIRAADTAVPATKPTAPQMVIYKPAKGSAPAARVTGGSRGNGDATITLDVLAPDDTGLTTQEQPSLFWYQSKPAKARFELTLIEQDKTKPVLRVDVERASNAGIQRLRLADHGVKLAPGVEYQWVIALVTDPDNRSSDLVASGFIKRIEPSPELKLKIAGATPETLPAIYAGAGIWHDALGSLTDLIDSQPDNQALRTERADLLRQVGLKAAAAAEGAPAKN
ncbi:MAG: DUF928 domain-containing protein [Verrucomicrobiales bacterium]|nr:DUF928 domain-containing protein [Verrucomicrobiales bacterium]